MRLVATDTGREYARLENPNQDRARYIAFSPDGTQLVLDGEADSLHVWDLRAIRDELAQRGLDWDLPPYPPAGDLPLCEKVLLDGYVRAGKTEQAAVLTKELAADARTQFFEDNPQLAGQLDGKFVASGQRSSWSPDGKKIVFGRSGNDNGILIYDIATHKTTELTTAGKDPAWAGKDGRWIAYVGGQSGTGPAETIWAAEVPDGKLFRLAAGCTPSWSSDGKTLFFQAFDKNQMMSTEVTGKGQFSPPRLQSAVPYRYPAVSPDGKRVAYKSGGDLVIQQMDDAKVAKRFALPKGNGMLGGWSPDSREFGFGGWNADDPMPCIILDVETGLARQVASRSLTLPAWSPDWARITFDLRLGTGTEIWMIDAEAVKKLPTFKMAAR
ncbi:MAG: hypothetical protein ACLP9L_25615 [Thermoguttaceae bacterium]